MNTARMTLRSSAALLAGLVTVLSCTQVQAADTSSLAELRHYVSGSAQDPQVRLAQYEYQEQQFFSSSSTLLSIEAESPKVRLAPAFYLQLADSTLAFGLPGVAESTYRQSAPNTQNPAALAQLQLRLASQLYARGRYDDALQLLKTIRDSLPANMLPEWQDLTSRCDLALGRNQDAIDVLTKLDNFSVQVPHARYNFITALLRPYVGVWSFNSIVYARYNLAIALLRVGRSQDGITELNHVGLMSVYNSDELALRDKANLVLGYYYLRHQQGGAAITFFERVRLVGPFSNRALLGLGWAELSARGQQLKPSDFGKPHEKNQYQSVSSIGALIRPGFLDDVIGRSERAKMLRSMRIKNTSSDKEEALRRALVPWSVLLSRDPMDPAVQEGQMAVPYALDRIGAHIEAEHYYEQAVTALQQTRKRLAQAKLNIKSNRMVDTIIKRDQDAQTGWLWRLTDLPDAVETFYLQRVIADHPYQGSIKSYRDLRLMQHDLDTLDKHLTQLQNDYADNAHAAAPLQYYIRSGDASLATDTDNGKTSAQGVALQMSDRLHTGMAGTIPTEQTASGLANLELAPAPAHFEGVWERSAVLREQIKALKPKVRQSLAAENQRLQHIALQALEQQDKIAKNYLVQVRFALARLYDRHDSSNGSAP